MLKLENVTKYYGDFLAVDDLSFEIKPGEIYGLLGVNGAGKTTTFRMILGLLEPTKGKITWNDKPIDYSVTDNIGYLTEERSLLVKLTVREQCLYYGALKGMSDEEILSKMDELLEKFKISEYRDKKIKELSKGNQQKIQFITAIINEPKLLILDEPFSGLDPFNIQIFKEEIVRLKEAGSSIIFSTHRMDHVEHFCEKLSIIMHGKVVIDGYLKKIKEDYMKKTIIVSGDIDIDAIKKLDGVLDIETNQTDYEVKVKDVTIADSVFDVIKNSKITKFIIEEPSLNDIFIEKVGESFEK